MAGWQGRVNDFLKIIERFFHGSRLAFFCESRRAGSGLYPDHIWTITAFVVPTNCETAGFSAKPMAGSWFRGGAGGKAAASPRRYAAGAGIRRIPTSLPKDGIRLR